MSKGSIQNFNQVAYEKLKDFEIWAYQTLLNSPLNNADETGVNVNRKGLWLHLLSNKEVALYHVDPARGSEAMNRMGVLPEYKGILCHDHWGSPVSWDDDNSRNSCYIDKFTQPSDEQG